MAIDRAEVIKRLNALNETGQYSADDMAAIVKRTMEKHAETSGPIPVSAQDPNRQVVQAKTTQEMTPSRSWWDTLKGAAAQDDYKVVNDVGRNLNRYGDAAFGGIPHMLGDAANYVIDKTIGRQPFETRQQREAFVADQERQKNEALPASISPYAPNMAGVSDIAGMLTGAKFGAERAAALGAAEQSTSQAGTAVNLLKDVGRAGPMGGVARNLPQSQSFLGKIAQGAALGAAGGYAAGEGSTGTNMALGAIVGGAVPALGEAYSAVRDPRGQLGRNIANRENAEPFLSSPEAEALPKGQAGMTAQADREATIGAERQARAYQAMQRDMGESKGRAAMQDDANIPLDVSDVQDTWNRSVRRVSNNEIVDPEYASHIDDMNRFTTRSEETAVPVRPRTSPAVSATVEPPMSRLPNRPGQLPPIEKPFTPDVSMPSASRAPSPAAAPVEVPFTPSAPPPNPNEGAGLAGLLGRARGSAVGGPRVPVKQPNIVLPQGEMESAFTGQRVSPVSRQLPPASGENFVVNRPRPLVLEPEPLPQTFMERARSRDVAGDFSARAPEATSSAMERARARGLEPTPGGFDEPSQQAWEMPENGGYTPASGSARPADMGGEEYVQEVMKMPRATVMDLITIKEKLAELAGFGGVGGDPKAAAAARKAWSAVDATLKDLAAKGNKAAQIHVEASDLFHQRATQLENENMLFVDDPDKGAFTKLGPDNKPMLDEAMLARRGALKFQKAGVPTTAGYNADIQLDKLAAINPDFARSISNMRGIAGQESLAFGRPNLNANPSKWEAVMPFVEKNLGAAAASAPAQETMRFFSKLNPGLGNVAPMSKLFNDIRNSAAGGQAESVGSKYNKYQERKKRDKMAEEAMKRRLDAEANAAATRRASEKQ
jgi:hypothetical protein